MKKEIVDRVMDSLPGASGALEDTLASLVAEPEPADAWTWTFDDEENRATVLVLASGCVYRLTAQLAATSREASECGCDLFPLGPAARYGVVVTYMPHREPAGGTWEITNQWFFHLDTKAHVPEELSKRTTIQIVGVASKPQDGHAFTTALAKAIAERQMR